jgi:hypothetical protein
MPITITKASPVQGTQLTPKTQGENAENDDFSPSKYMPELFDLPAKPST